MNLDYRVNIYFIVVYCNGHSLDLATCRRDECGIPFLFLSEVQILDSKPGVSEPQTDGGYGVKPQAGGGCFGGFFGWAEGDSLGSSLLRFAASEDHAGL